jgi:peptidoglycan hydrolase-like protein with peptidoglycan-binding domain
MLLVAVAAVVAAGVGAVAFVGRDEAPQAPPRPRVATTKVVRTDLADTQTFAGTLGYGGVTTLKGTGTGTVTKLPAIGAVAARGAPLYWVDGHPVPVFFGDTPLYRPLDVPDLEGPDVAVVAANLAALGYPVSARARRTTPALLAAVRRWQEKVGMAPTGTLAPGQVVVLAGPVRVNSVTAQLGDQVGEELLTVTATTKVVTMPVEAGEVHGLRTGMPVTVVRPDGRELPATVASVSTAVTGTAEDQAQTGGPPKVEVLVTPDDQQAVGDLDSAAVQVRVTGEVREGVLAVAVGALVALREGGYAVQLPDGTYRAVTTGMFSRELVEISGEGITAGLTVVTAS